MEANDIVIFTGCSEISWGFYTGNPKELVVGERYQVEQIEVHSWHTKVWLKNVEGSFNSVCFEVFEAKEKRMTIEWEKEFAERFKKSHWYNVMQNSNHGTKGLKSFIQEHVEKAIKNERNKLIDEILENQVCIAGRDMVKVEDIENKEVK